MSDKNSKSMDKQRMDKKSNKRGNRNYNKKETREDKFDERKLKGAKPTSNHPQWYGAESTLMKDAANISFHNAAGIEAQIRATDSSITLKGNTGWTNAGIMKLDFVSVPGECGSWSDPVNVAVRDIYSYIRHANSGSKNYDAADLGMYLVAYDSAVQFYAYMVRLYGLLRTTKLQNRYTPETLVTTAGGDYNSLVANMAQLRAYINTYAARLNVMKVPSNFHLIERHMWMCSNVFMDAPIDKAQLYVFTPYKFWIYKVGETPDKTKHVLDYAPGSEGSDFGRITRCGGELLDSILNNEDFNIMSGDIMKAYADKVFTLNLISEDYHVEPVFDPEVLMQIHNLTLTPIANEGTDWYISEDRDEGTNVGAIVGHFPVSFRDAIATRAYTTPLIDMPVANPDPTLVCLATRFTNLAHATKDVATSKWVYKVHVHGTEIIVGGNVYIKPHTRIGLGGINADVIGTKIEQFAFHPFIYRATNLEPETTDTAPESTFYGISGDVDNWALISQEVLENIHRAALLGMYGLAD